MSSRRPPSSRAFLRHRKSRWKSKLFILLLLAGAGWLIYSYVWRPVVAWFEPRIVVVESQKEAMNKLHGLLAVWDGSTEQLAQLAKDRDKTFAWMSDGESRLALDWLLVQELNHRGAWADAHPILMEILQKQLTDSAKKSEKERSRNIANCYDWACLMLKRGDATNAEILLDTIIDRGADGNIDSLIECIKLSSDIKSKAGKMDQAGALVAKIQSNDLLSKVKNPTTIKETARLLLLSDYIAAKDQKVPVTKGREMARWMLEKAELSSSPEMGLVILSDSYALYAKDSLTPQEVEQLCGMLERSLVCFRATANDMSYAPEVMLGIARMELLKGHPELALNWLDKAEGAAMTLGVDTPRILTSHAQEGASTLSIKEGAAALRAEIQRVSKARKTMEEIDEKLEKADVFIDNKAWALADTTLKEAFEDIKANTVFARGYMPVCLAKKADLFVAQKKLEEAAAIYESLIGQWNALEEKDKSILETNLKNLGASNLYVKIHEDYAPVCVKLDRITRSKQVLAEINKDDPQPDKNNKQ